MKKTVRFIYGLLLAGAILSLNACNDEDEVFLHQDQDIVQGYWYGDSLIVLTPQDNGEYLVLARPTKHPISKEKVRALIDNEYTERISDWSDGVYRIKTTKRPSDHRLYVSDYYKTPEGYWYFVLPKIYINLKPGIEINTIIKKYKNIFTLKDHRERYYCYSCNVGTSFEMLEILRDLHDKSGVESCFVNNETPLIPCNTYYSYQYYINNASSTSLIKDLNVEAAWQMVTGSPNITVAVIDDGVEHNHEDMSICLLNGYTAENPSGNGNPQNENQY